MGEGVAVRYLRRRGFYVMARNVRIGPGEIDIVAREKPHRVIWRNLCDCWRAKRLLRSCLQNISREIHTVHFIEVKTTVAREIFYDPAGLFTKKKARLFLLAARAWVRREGVCHGTLSLLTVLLDLTDKKACCKRTVFRVLE